MKKKLLVWIIVAVAVLMIPLFVLTGKNVISNVDLFDTNSEVEQEKTVQNKDEENKDKTLEVKSSDDNDESKAVAEKLKGKLESQQEGETVSEEDIAKQDEILELSSFVQKIIEQDESILSLYAGDYIDDDGDLVICVTDKNASNKIKEQVGEELSNTSNEYIDENNVEYKVVEYSKETLDNTKKALYDKNSTIDKSALTSDQSDVLSRLVSYGVDYKENCISVGIQEYTENDKDTFESIFGVISCVKCREQAPISTASTYKPGRGLCYYYCYGSELYFNKRVSMGYAAYKVDPQGNKVYGFVTCAHDVITRHDNHIYSDNTPSPNNIFGIVYENGFEVDTGNCRLDYSFVKVLPNHNISVKIDSHKDTSSSQTETLSLKSTSNPIVDPVQGTKVWKQGATSGCTYSTVEYVDQTISMNGYDFNFDSIALTNTDFIDGGDSGGIVYSKYSGSKYLVAGVVSFEGINHGGFTQAKNIRDERRIHVSTEAKSNQASATSGKCGSNLSWSFNSSTGALSITGTGAMYDYYSAPWSDHYNKIKSVTIGSGVTSIGDYAFYNCTSLQSVSISNTVKTIGTYAFAWCTSLATITANGEFDSIEYHAFYKCNSITTKKKPGWIWCKGYNESGVPYLEWKPVVGAVKYQIFYSVSENGNYSRCQDNIFENKFKNNATVVGTGYYYKVRAVFSDGTYTESSADYGERRCPMPVATASIDAATGKPKLEWDAVSGATKYIVGYKAAPIDDEEKEEYIFQKYVDETSYIFTDVPVGSKYYYTVRAVDKQELNSYTDYYDMTCKYPCPTGLRVSIDATTGKPRVEWNPVPGESHYWLECSSDGKTFYSLAGSVSETSYVHENAEVGTSYLYRVKSMNSEFTKNLGYTYIFEMRVTDEIDAESGKPKLRWKYDSRAIRYNISRSTEKNGSYEIIHTIEKKDIDDYLDVDGYHCLLIDETAEFGNTYYYVVTFGGPGYGYSSSEIEVICKLASPPGMKVEIDAKTGKPIVSWGRVNGTDLYEISYSTDGKNFSDPISMTSREWLNETAEIGNYYYYRIQAVHPTNSKLSSDYSENSPYKYRFNMTVTHSIDADSGKPKLKWNVDSAVIRYTVSRSTEKNGSYEIIHTIEKKDIDDYLDVDGYHCLLIDETAEFGNKYYYIVNFNGAGYSYSSTAVEVTCDYLKEPQVTPSNVASTGKPKLSWTKDSLVEKYYVLRSDSENGDYTSIAEIIPDEVKGDVIEYTDDLAVTKRSYYYKVQAEAYGTSVYSTPVKITTKYAQPQNFKVEIDTQSGKPKLSWDVVPLTRTYQYCYSTDGKNYGEPIKVVGTEVVHTDAQYGTTYYYKVQAINNNSSAINSAYSEVKTIKLLQQPQNVNAVIDDETKKTTISWDEVAGADYYIVYLSPLEHTAYSELGRSTTTTYENSGHYIGEIYYKVKACSNDGGTSALSESKEVIYKLSKPVIKVTTDASTDKPKISWDRGDVVTHYYVYKVDKTTGEYTIITVVSCNNNRKSYAVVDTTAKVGEIYEYTIKACYPNDPRFDSDCADLVSYQTRCAKPVVTSSIDEATGKPKLSWNTVNGANGYYIYRSNIKGSSGKYIGSTGATDCIDYSAQPGETYYYTVKAIVTKNSSASSLLSSPAMCKCDEIGTIRMNISYNRGTYKPLLIWKNVTGASKYTIYRSNKEDGEFEAIANNSSDKLTYIDDDAMPGRRYYYKVEATTRRNGNEYVIAATDVQAYTRRIATPILVVSKDEVTGKPQLSWNEVYGATHYYVYYLNEVSKKYEPLAATGDTTYIHETAEQGETYSYKVVAAVDAQVEQDYDSLVEAAVSIDETISSCNLSWQEVENATHYYVYYSLDEGETYKVLTVINGTSYVTSKTQADIIYKVEARYSIDTAVCSELSEVVRITI